MTVPPFCRLRLQTSALTQPGSLKQTSTASLADEFEFKFAPLRYTLARPRGETVGCSGQGGFTG
jgi:hypothetical protein